MTKLLGKTRVPSDKSITHRAILFSGLAAGGSRVLAYRPGRDNYASARVMANLGVDVVAKVPGESIEIARQELSTEITESFEAETQFLIKGAGYELKKPSVSLDCGNSGTTARLLCGILAGQDFEAEIVGDQSLSKRPFKRASEPLSQMGASFSGDKLPLRVTGAGNKLKGIEFHSPRASAQVKSLILLAGLRAEGTTSVFEPLCSRDHTEVLLSEMGAELERKTEESGKYQVSVKGPQEPLRPLEFRVPGDISSAWFLLIASSVLPGSKLTIENVGLNPSRSHCLEILREAGVSIEIVNSLRAGGELVGDIKVAASELSAISLGKESVAKAIDEIPALSVLLAFANGVSEIRGAEELRVKESDRISETVHLLTSYGVKVEELEDGLIIHGTSLQSLREKALENPQQASQLKAERVKRLQACHDHRICMSSTILEFLINSKLELECPEVVETSFPFFISTLSALIKE